MNTADAIVEAVAALRRGEAIGLPTETVYGLAADASSPDAVRRIFEIKGRPADHPLIVHVADAKAIDAWALDVPAAARALADAFWPGPLTIILRKQPHVPDEVTGGQSTVGLRCPAHPLALAVLQQFGGGLAAPSANRFGRISPTTAEHVRGEFGAAVPLVLDGGDCAVGIESTIIDLSGATPRILRPGMIGREAIEAVIGPVQDGPSAHSPRASGTLEAHYAPRTPLLLLPRAALLAEAQQQQAFGKRVAVLAVQTLPPSLPGLALAADAAGYAHDLYAALRELDGHGANVLLVERPPDDGAWIAVHDRLRRSAAGAGIDVDDDTP